MDNEELTDQETDSPLFSKDLDVHQEAFVDTNKAYFTLTVQNNGNTPLPCAPGHHTYYQVAHNEKANIRIEGTKLNSEEITTYLINGK